MRINDELLPKVIDRKKGKGAAPGKSTQGGGLTSLFALNLGRQTTEIDSRQRELEELKQDIDKAGNDLERDPTMANFKTFRGLITELSRKVLTGAYKVEMQGGPNSPHIHEIITVVDKKADELYRLVMGEQKDRLAITNKIMELKGLVVDFLH
jgi:uncharacterized protein YaaR (DUF327 family)